MKSVQFTTKSGQNKCDSSSSSIIELIDSKFNLVNESTFYVLVNHNGSTIVCICELQCRFLDLSIYLFDNYTFRYDFYYEWTCSQSNQSIFPFSRNLITSQLKGVVNINLKPVYTYRIYQTVFLEEYRLEARPCLRSSFLSKYLSPNSVKFQIQSSGYQASYSDIFRLFDTILGKKFPHLLKPDSDDYKLMIQQIDNVRELCYQLYKCTNLFDVWHAIGLYLRMCNKTNVVFDVVVHLELSLDFFQKIFGEGFSLASLDFKVQSGGDSPIDKFLSMLGQLKDNFSEVRNCPLWLKFHKAMMFLMSKSYFDTLGLDLTKFGYNRFEKAAEAKNHSSSADFFECMLDTSHFILTSLWSCVQTGQISSLLHGESSYITYINDCDLVKKQVLWLNEPEEHGFSESSFFELLEKVVRNGDDIIKHCKNQMSKFDYDKIMRQVSDMKMIHCEQFSLRRAREHRSSPFSVLLAGSSSVGKTTLVEILFKSYANIFNLPNDATFKYTKNPVAKYWDGFKTYMWAILMDDIAFMHPNSASQGDPTLMEIIQVINNCPHVPDQAALDDKGRIPNRAKFVIATTNTVHLNAHAYYSCPLAARRRLPNVVDVTVKPEFATNGMLDSSKTFLDENQMPNWWIFTVKKIYCEDPAGINVNLIDAESFSDIYEFLAWFRTQSLQHSKTQKLIMSNNQSFDNIALQYLW